MPMQPSPMADTSRLVLPSVRFCIRSPSGTRLEFDPGRPCQRAQHRLDVGRCDGRVLGAIGSVDLVVDALVGTGEPDVLVDASSLNVALVAYLRGGNQAAPCGAGTE